MLSEFEDINLQNTSFPTAVHSPKRIFERLSKLAPFFLSARNMCDAFHRYQVKLPRSPVRLPYRETFSDVTITALIAGSSSFAEWRVTGLNSRFHGIRVRSSFRGNPSSPTRVLGPEFELYLRRSEDAASCGVDMRFAGFPVIFARVKLRKFRVVPRYVIEDAVQALRNRVTCTGTYSSTCCVCIQLETRSRRIENYEFIRNYRLITSSFAAIRFPTNSSIFQSILSISGFRVCLLIGTFTVNDLRKL